MNFANDITDLIGNTPLIKLRDISNETGNIVLGKCEFLNPTHSVKDRLALGVLQDGLEKGTISQGSTIIEPTSGNTGIALAAICATYKMKVILTMPSSMSVERQKLVKFLGAEVVLTEPALGMRGAVDKANELLEKTPNAIMLQQFNNMANVKAHRETTAVEILRDTDNKVDIFVASSGTSGTITGVGEALKAHNKDIKIILTEPEESTLIANGTVGPHKIQGIGPNFIPEVFNQNVIDEYMSISFDDAIRASRNIAKKEGLLVGISSGANIHSAHKIARKYKNQNKVIVTILCDTGERYISTALYE